MAEVSVAKRLKEWRSKHSLTQEQAAKRLKISVFSLRNWEQEYRRPSRLATEKLLEMINAPDGRKKKISH